MTRRARIRIAVLATLLVGGATFWYRWARPVDAAALEQDSGGPRARVVIVGTPGDPRIAFAREALAHWNGEFARLGRRLHFDSGTVHADSLPDALLRSASGEATIGIGPATMRLQSAIARQPADIVIALSQDDLISFSVRWRARSRGVVGVRRSDIPPLSLPNTARNVIAHELGHVLGLDHNADSTTLMCGRPASCRPAAFAADTARFFPLTAADEQAIRSRWP